jgi:MioC protein
MQTDRTLRILVGTVTSTAEYVAQAIELDCADLVDHIDVRMMDDLDPSVFEGAALYLICTSTFGEGDVPDNARSLYEGLTRSGLRLDGVRYGVIALGDSKYPQTFCNGGRRFDERLTAVGATRVGELLCLDASTELEPEARGAAWCRTWLAEALP